MNKLLLTIPALACTALSFGLFESFDNIGGTTSNGQLGGANLEAQGWFFNNQSGALGETDWFNDTTKNIISDTHSGPEALVANFHNGAGATTISNWALTPVLNLSDGSTFSFWARTTVNPSSFPDRLQFRMSTNGASTSTGTSATDVGDFTTLLVDINPNYSASVFPAGWTQFQGTLSGIGAPTTGRMAFRYFVENGGPTGTRSDGIGIDDFSYTEGVPEPATMLVLGGLAAAAVARRKRK